MYKFLATIYPKNLREKYKQLLLYADIKIEPNRFLGFILSFGIGLSLALSLILASLIRLPLVLLFIASFILFEVVVYFVIALRSDKKGKFVENVLPDALQLMASNLRAGLTTDRALLLSARPEFGPFQDEINSVGKEITTGKSIQESLLTMTKRIKSEKLEKTILLIVSGLKSGGELASLLEQTASNLRQQMFVEERIRSSVMMYVIFIFGAVALGSPMLFGLSSFLVEVLTKNLGAIQLPETTMTATLPLSFSNITISNQFITTFALVSLITSSVLGSLILGLVSKGKERYGLKFMPILIFISVSVFFVVRYLVRNMLGGLFGI